VLYLELARRDLKWTQNDLSQRARISQQFISDMELGKVWPTPEQRERLARILNVPAHLLLESVPVGGTELAER
jgi:transcriptional regulator with XRE-family HTH domain